METEARALHAKMVRVLGAKDARALWKKVGQSRPGRIRGETLVDTAVLLERYDREIDGAGRAGLPRETNARFVAEKLFPEGKRGASVPEVAREIRTT